MYLNDMDLHFDMGPFIQIHSRPAYRTGMSVAPAPIKLVEFFTICNGLRNK